MWYRCDNCKHCAEGEDMPNAKELSQRLTEGMKYTTKECPECSCLAFPVEMTSTSQMYIVMVLGYWGRGKTVKKAAQACRKAGALKTEKAIVRMVIDPIEEPYVNGDGSICYKSDYYLVDVIDMVKLGALLDAES